LLGSWLVIGSKPASWISFQFFALKGCLRIAVELMEIEESSRKLLILETQFSIAEEKGEG